MESENLGEAYSFALHFVTGSQSSVYFSRANQTVDMPALNC